MRPRALPASSTVRICLVYDCLYPYTVGGAERWYRALAERLADAGHDVTYLTLRQWDSGAEPTIPGVRVIAVGPRLELYVAGRRRIWPALRFGLGVLRHLLRHGRQCDLVHCASTPFFALLDLVGLNLVLLAFFAFYGLSQLEAGRLTLKRFLMIPLALGLGMALMVNSSRGVLEALFGHRSEFVRTPKEGDRPDPSYRARMAVWQSIVEVVFGIYVFVSSAVLASRGTSWGLPLHLLVGAGFLYLGLGSLRFHWRAPAPAAAAETEPLPSQA